MRIAPGLHWSAVAVTHAGLGGPARNALPQRCGRRGRMQVCACWQTHIVLQLLTSWMWDIVTWSAFSSLRVHFQPSGSRVARHVPVVGGVTWMEGTCVRTEHSWVVQQSLLPSHAWQAAHACC